MTDEEIKELISEWIHAADERDEMLDLPALVRLAIAAEREAIAVELDDAVVDLRRRALFCEGDGQWGTQAKLNSRADELRGRAAAIRKRGEK